MDREMEIISRVNSVNKINEDDRTVVFQISDASKDRHGTVLNMSNWNLENFNKNGIVGYQHDVHGGGMCNAPNPDQVLGIGKAWLEDVNGEMVLMGSVQFETEDINPLAEKIYKKVKNGTLKAVSVGFMPLVDEKGSRGRNGYINKEGDIEDESTFYFYGQELLEFSIVNIPSNANALKRGLRDVASNALQFIHRELGLSYGEIEKMSVRNVLDLIEHPEIKSIDTKENDSKESEPDIREGFRLKRRKHKYVLIKGD